MTLKELLHSPPPVDLEARQKQTAEFIKKDKEKAAALLRSALQKLSDSEPTSQSKVRKVWI